MAIIISQIVREWIEENDTSASLSPSEIAQKLVETDKRIRSLYTNNITTLRKLISKIRSVDKKKILVNEHADGEIKTKYHVKEEKYVFQPKKGIFSLPINVVDELFYSYSEHGLNWSSQQIVQHYKLEPWQWHAIKSALYLYKKSPIFAPFTLANTDPEVMKEMIREKLAEHVHTIPQQIEREYHKNIFKEYKKTIKKQAEQDYFYQTIGHELADLLPDLTIERKVFKEEGKRKRVINVVWADLHYGAKNPENPHLPTFGVTVLKQAFDEQVLPIIASYKADEVNLFIAGDLIESATGLNHPNSWQGMEPGAYGAELIADCTEFILEAASNITNLTKIIGVAGNHDRSTPDKKHDTQGVFASIIFKFIERSMRNTGVEVIYDQRLTSIEIDKIQYLMSHGHEALTNKPEQLVLKYGNQHLFNVLISGHWHTRKIRVDTDFLRDLVVASIFPGNDYSIGIGFRTLGGFTIVENNGYNFPLTHDHPIVYECYK